MNTPTLRFKEFSGAWEVKKLGDIATFSKGKGISKADIDENGKTFCIRYGELYTEYGETINKVKSKTNVHVDNLVLSEINDVIIPASGETQIDIATASCVQVSGVALGSDLNIIKSKENGVFLTYYLNNQKKLEIAKLAQGNSVVHLYSSQLKLLALNLPDKKEQTKIANFLTAIDEKIAQLTQKQDLLTQYKKGVMQQIFSQQLRFKDDDGREFAEWEEKSLGEVFAEIKDKIGAINDIETYSISAGKGFVSQQEKFGKDISGNQNQNYISLKPFEFAYNKGSSKTFKYGCVYPNTTGNIISVPNVFISFRSKLPIATHFYSKLFEWHYLDTYLKKIISSSARMDGLLNVSKKDFFEIEIPYPCIEEQTKIANFLTAIDDKINHNQTQLDAMKQYKSGLLQQMFV